MHRINIQILVDAWVDEDNQIGTLKFLIQLFLAISVFRNLIFFGNIWSFWRPSIEFFKWVLSYFQDSQSWKFSSFRNFIFLDIWKWIWIPIEEMTTRFLFNEILACFRPRSKTAWWNQRCKNRNFWFYEIITILET